MAQTGGWADGKLSSRRRPNEQRMTQTGGLADGKLRPGRNRAPMSMKFLCDMICR
jgi:hypothetical protein